MYSEYEQQVMHRISEIEHMRQMQEHKFFSTICMDELLELITDLRVMVVKVKGLWK